MGQIAKGPKGIKELKNNEEYAQLYHIITENLEEITLPVSVTLLLGLENLNV